MENKVNKHYKQAYNNPSQYDFNKIVTALEEEKNPRASKMFLNISRALKQAKADKIKGTYKFI